MCKYSNYKLKRLFANILYPDYLKTKSRLFEDMDLVFSCMCCKLETIESEHKNVNLVYDREISYILMTCQNACTHV